MGKRLNEKGITLVELLASIVLASIIMLLVYSVLMTGIKQYNNQFEKNNQQTDISYTLKIITKDIRKTANPIWKSNKEIELNGINYSFDGNTITRNGLVIAPSIVDFNVQEETQEEDRKWIITVTSSTKQGNKKTETTTIYLRKGEE